MWGYIGGSILLMSAAVVLGGGISALGWPGVFIVPLGFYASWRALRD